MIAGQLHSPLKEIPPEKIADLLAIKRKLGLPDSRYATSGDRLNPVETAAPSGFEPMAGTPSSEEIDSFVQSLSLQVAEFFKEAHAQYR
jgi:hypothetical protein